MFLLLGLRATIVSVLSVGISTSLDFPLPLVIFIFPSVAVESGLVAEPFLSTVFTMTSLFLYWLSVRVNVVSLDSPL